jgi:antibiotic biosynthesis monooxygenase (ABM) superfamily enzyme
MIIFNTTFHVANEVSQAYVLFLKTSYIPQAIASGFLMQPRFSRVMQDSTADGESYSIQFRVKNVDTLNYWMEQEGRILNKALVEKFGQSVVGFSTLLEEIKLGE